MAVIDLVEHISTAINNKQYTVGNCIDLSKAFDTILHRLLSKEMKDLLSEALQMNG